MAKSDQELSIDKVAIEQWQRAKPERDPLSGNIKIRIFLLGTYLAHEHDERSQKLGISGSEMLILFALRRSDRELRPTDLFKSLLVPSGTMTRHVDSLEKRGLVKRRPNPEDRRGSLISLTKKGAKTADDALNGSHRTSFLDKHLAAMSKGDQLKLDELLAQLVGGSDSD